jgi:FkbM family methyltransferase
MMRVWDRAYGFGRSLWTYYGRPSYRQATESFYRQFVGPGALCFDIGAHVGNRTLAWSRLGARVVAVEPQPDFARFLGWLFRRRANVTVRPLAVAAESGTVTLFVSARTPNVTSGSRRFIEEVRQVDSFAWVRWEQRVEVAATTLDSLIAEHGMPDFVKIDVEGMEHEVLAGVTRPLPAVSFEFIPSALDSALASLELLQALGRYRYNVSLGESMRLALPDWVDAQAMRAWLEARDPDGDSGDIYALLDG